MVIKELILSGKKIKRKSKELEKKIESYAKSKIEYMGHNKIKTLIWTIAFLSFGVFDWITTYYITVVLGGVEKNHFLQITGFHEQFVGFILLKGLGLLLLLFIAEFVSRQAEEHDVDIPGVYYFIPLFLIILGVKANINNITILLEYIV